MQKKVLIVTYYWPPSGGSGVQRWLKFVKYLPQVGWEPYVFTPENPSFAVQDESLLRDVPSEARVIRFPIWEPYDAFHWLSNIFGSSKKTKGIVHVTASKKKSLFQLVGTWVRGNLFIPDPRRFWIRPSVNFLEDFIRSNEISVVITTGPPHSMHLIGYRLKKKIPSLRWLADFRDPWSAWGLLDSLMAGRLARRIHKSLESKVLRRADQIITITPFYVRHFELLSGKKVTLLTNGFDEDDFKTITYKRSDTFLIRHIGWVNEKCNPRPFMQALKNLIVGHPDVGRYIQMEFIGEVHPQFREFVERDEILRSVTKFTASIPHRQLLERYGESSLLLLVLTGYKDAEGFMPGKLFEYMATGLPILGVGPVAGDAAALLEETGAGKMMADENLQGIEEYMLKTFYQWKDQASMRLLKAPVLKYSRYELTRQLVRLLQ